MDIGGVANTQPERSPWVVNLAPAIVVTLVSIPMSMGVAIASGVPPARGLTTAIIGGLIVGMLSGSPRQISGPSAGQAVMVLETVNQHGVAALGAVVPLMGIMQAAAGLLKVGQLFRAVSPAVINGMLAGIGALIFASQFHVMVDDLPKETGLDNLFSIPGAVVKGVAASGDPVHRHAAIIGLLTLAVLVGMSFARGRLAKIPPPLAAVIIATGATMAFGWGIRRVDMPESFLDALVYPGSEHLAMLTKPSIIVSAVALAFVATAETLLCSSAVDAMHDGERTNYDRELVAQGIGNLCCGVVGAPPVTGVITRSSVNVAAGATGRQSALMVGMGLLAFVAAIPGVLEVIPRASLAAILVFIGYRLMRYRPYRELARYGRSELIIFLVSVAVIVGVNLLTGIILGVVLALAKLLYSIGRGFHRFDVEIVPDEEHARTHVHLRGAASFIRLPKLASTLEALPGDREIHLHVEELDYIDHACLDIMTRWERQRIRARTPVRVEWNYLHHKYHKQNPLDVTPPEHEEEPEHPHGVLDFFIPELVFVGDVFRTKQEAIETLGLRLVRHHELGVDGAAFIDSALHREEESSTCLGSGLMVPHGVLRSRHEVLGVIAISHDGWDFETPDDRPVRCIVLLATHVDAASHHLAVLAAFARLFSLKPELRDRLLNAADAGEVIELLHGDDAAEINYPFERVTRVPDEAGNASDAEAS